MSCAAPDRLADLGADVPRWPTLAPRCDASSLSQLSSPPSGSPRRRSPQAGRPILHRSCSTVRATTSTRTPATSRSSTRPSSSNRNDDPNGPRHQRADLLLPGRAGARFIAGEDTGQPDIVQGWGIFRLQRQQGRQARGRRRSASSSPPTRARATTPRTTAAGCSPTAASSPPTSATRRRAPRTASSSSGSRHSPRASRAGDAGNVGRCRTASSTSGSAPRAASRIDDEDRVYVASARGASGRRPALHRPVPDARRRRRAVAGRRTHRRADGRQRDAGARSSPPARRPRARRARSRPRRTAVGTCRA